MLKKIWAKIKGFFTSSIKAKIMAEIDGLDKYEDDLAALIDKKIDEKAIAKKIVDFFQKILKDLVEKIL